jgi:hypothetical protein
MGRSRLFVREDSDDVLSRWLYSSTPGSAAMSMSE